MSCWEMVQINKNTIDNLKNNVNNIDKLKLLMNKQFSQKELESKLIELEFKKDEIKKILNHAGIPVKEIWTDIKKQKCLMCEGALRGLPLSWNKFVSVYSPLMWSSVRKKLSSGKQETVIQEIYVKILRSGLKNWCTNPVYSFSPYLQKIINNSIIDEHKKNSGLYIIDDITITVLETLEPPVFSLDKIKNLKNLGERRFSYDELKKTLEELSFDESEFKLILEQTRKEGIQYSNLDAAELEGTGEDDEPLENLSSGENPVYSDPEKVLLKKETLEKAKSGLLFLKETDRFIVYNYHCGWDFSEIAEKLGKTEFAVRKAYRRALDKMKDYIISISSIN